MSVAPKQIVVKSLQLCVRYQNLSTQNIERVDIARKHETEDLHVGSAPSNQNISNDKHQGALMVSHPIL